MPEFRATCRTLWYEHVSAACRLQHDQLLVKYFTATMHGFFCVRPEQPDLVVSEGVRGLIELSWHLQSALYSHYGLISQTYFSIESRQILTEQIFVRIYSRKTDVRSALLRCLRVHLLRERLCYVLSFDCAMYLVLT